MFAQATSVWTFGDSILTRATVSSKCNLLIPPPGHISSDTTVIISCQVLPVREWKASSVHLPRWTSVEPSSQSVRLAGQRSMPCWKTLWRWPVVTDHTYILQKLLCHEILQVLKWLEESQGGKAPSQLGFLLPSVYSANLPFLNWYSSSTTEAEFKTLLNRPMIWDLIWSDKVHWSGSLSD